MSSGRPTVTPAQALDVVLCWGWIDGQRKGFDEHSFLQRYSPRTPKSRWSEINREHVARLSAAGRMTPHGQRQIDAAKADGRWDAAYAPMRCDRRVVDSGRSARGDPREPARAEDLRDAEQAEPVLARVSYQRDEDRRRPREEDCRAGCNAGARAGHRPRSAAAAGAGYIVVSEKSLTVKVAFAPLVDTSSTP